MIRRKRATDTQPDPQGRESGHSDRLSGIPANPLTGDLPPERWDNPGNGMKWCACGLHIQPKHLRACVVCRPDLYVTRPAATREPVTGPYGAMSITHQRHEEAS